MAMISSAINQIALFIAQQHAVASAIVRDSEMRLVSTTLRTSLRDASNRNPGECSCRLVWLP